MTSLLDDVGPDARRLLDILMEAWDRTDQWPIRQYVAHAMATAGLDLRDVLRELPEWDLQYQTVRVLRSPNPVPNAPPELGDQIVPTVHGLVHCGPGTADQMVKAFLASVAVGYARQLGFVPNPVTVKPVTLPSDALIAGIRQQLGPFGEVNRRQVRLMLAGERASLPPRPSMTAWTGPVTRGRGRRDVAQRRPDRRPVMIGEELLQRVTVAELARDASVRGERLAFTERVGQHRRPQSCETAGSASRAPEPRLWNWSWSKR